MLHQKYHRKFSAIFLLVASFTFLSCTKLSNKVDETAFACGKDFALGPSEKFVKIHPEGRDHLEASEIRTLQISAVGVDGLSRRILPSSKGCVKIDGSSLRVRADSEGEVLTAVIDGKDSLIAGGKSLSLIALQDPNFQFQCPERGVFGHASVRLPLIANFNGRPQSASVDITARSLSQKIVYSLWKKDFGSSSEVPTSFDISKIPVGDYQIEILSSQMKVSSDDRPQYVRTTEECVLHKLDKVIDLASVSQMSVKAVGDDITPKLEAGAELHMCRESMSGTIPKLGERAVCKAKAECLKPENFRTVSSVVAQTAGVFQYFYFTQDQADQVSEVACSQYLVSDAAPSIDMRWDDPKLSRPNAILPDFRSQIKVSISTRHKLLANEDFKVQCKGQFKTATGEILTSNSVTCLSEQCKGQILADYVPCNGDLEMDFRNVYSSHELSQSIFVLTAKTEDGAGHINNEERSFWIDRSKIKSQTFTPNSYESVSDAQFIYGSQIGEAFFVNKMGSQNDADIEPAKSGIIKGGTYIDTPQYSDNYKVIEEAFRDPSGLIFVAWRETAVNEHGQQTNRCLLTKIIDQAFQPYSDEPFNDCGNKRFFADGIEGFWVSSNNPDGSKDLEWHRNTEVVKTHFERSETIGDACFISQAALPQQTVYFKCDKKIFQHNLADRKAISLSEDLVSDDSDLSLSMDNARNVWIATTDYDSNNVWFYKNGERTEVTQKVKELKQEWVPKTLARGFFTVGNYFWSETDAAFHNFVLENRFVLKKGDQVYTNPLGFTIICNYRDVRIDFDGEEIVWSRSEISVERLPDVLPCSDVHILNKKTMYVTARSGTINLVRNEDWMLFDSERYPFQKFSPIKDLKFFNGKPLALHVGGELVKFENNKWEKMDYNLPDEINQNQRFHFNIYASKYIGVIQNSSLWITEDLKNWKKVLEDVPYVEMEYSFFVQAAADGTMFWLKDKDIMSNRNGIVQKEFSVLQMSPVTGAECGGDVWIISRSIPAEGRGIALARYSSKTHDIKEFEMPLGDYDYAMRVSCIDESKILIKTNSLKEGRSRNAVFSIDDLSVKLVGPDSPGMFSDYFWIKSADAYLYENTLLDADFTPVNSSSMQDFRELEGSSFYFGTMDPAGGLWIYNNASLGRVDL